jgi:ABC-type dipeptide/oligopeptide/nickel transport system ATPase subunit
MMIVGRSGSGKSTLARCVAEWERPDEGRVEIFGGVKVQLIPQEPGASLNPHWTAAEAVAEPYRLGGYPKGEAIELAMKWINRMELPANAGHKLTSHCSGGEQARLAIARALTAITMDKGSAGLLIFDEAFSALDQDLRIRILELLLGLQHEFGVTFIFTSHDLAITSCYAERIVVMHQGELVEQGERDQMLTAPKSQAMQSLLAAAQSY